jgi:hypothetical protein
MARPRSALASVLVSVLTLLPRNDPTVRRTIRDVVVLQFEGLTRIALVAFSDTILGLDQQTIAHDRHAMDLTDNTRWSPSCTLGCSDFGVVVHCERSARGARDRAESRGRP